MFGEYRLLDRAACAAVRDEVLAQERHWMLRWRSRFELATLGTAEYLDGVEALGVYAKTVATTNRMLRRSFGDLLERVRVFFADLLDAPVSFDRKLALPGFHVVTFSGAELGTDDPSPRAHFDLQWMRLFVNRPEQTISFTLPIELPVGGGSMAVWDLRYREGLDLAIEARQLAASHPWETLAYRRGRIVVNDGLRLHAIGPASKSAPKGRRITLQGHGARLPKGWVLYW